MKCDFFKYFFLSQTKTPVKRNKCRAKMQCVSQLAKHITHGFSPMDGFLASSISPDIFLRKRLCMFFSSMFLSLSPCGALHLAWAAIVLAYGIGVWIYRPRKITETSLLTSINYLRPTACKIVTCCCLELFGLQRALLRHLLVRLPLECVRFY